MRLRSITVKRLPGITEEYTVGEIADGVTVVSGPNAIGKSSLVRALRHLLSEERGLSDVHVAATFVDEEGATWEVENIGGVTSWLCEGRVAGRPPLPPAELLDRWLLSMEGLLGPAENDERFVAEIRSQLTGGYDVDNVRKELAENVKPITSTTNLAKALDETAKRLGSVKSTYKELEEKRCRKLPEKKEKRRRAQKMRERLILVEKALEAASLLEELDELEQEISLLPEIASKVPEKIKEDIDNASSELERTRREIEDVMYRLEAERAELEQTGLAGKRPGQDTLAAMKRLAGDMKNIEDAIDKARERVQRERAARDKALEQLGGVPHRVPERAEKLLTELREPLERYKQLEQTCSALQDRLSELGQADDERQLVRDLELRRDAIKALRGWLNSPGTGQGGWLVPLVSTAAVLGLVAAIVSAISRQWAVFVLSAAASVCAAAALVVVLLMAGRRGIYREQFRKTGLQEPQAWSWQDACLLIERLEEDVKLLDERLSRCRDAKKLEAELANKRERLKALERQLDALCASAGLENSKPYVNLYLWLDAAVAFARAERELARAEGELSEHERRLADVVGELARMLKPWLGGLEPDPVRLKEAVESLGDRAVRAEEKEKTCRNLERELGKLRERERQLLERLDGLWKQAGLAPNDWAGLERLLEDIGRWKILEDERKKKKAVVQDHLKKIANDSELIDLAEDRQVRRLEELKQEMEKVAGEYDELTRQIAEIETSLKNAGSEKELAMAIAEHQKAVFNAREEYRARAMSMIELELLDTLAEKVRNEQEPEVLTRAREWFEKFTRRNFSLEITDHGIVGKDKKSGRRRALGDLSTGTRMQLLLALRLAWIDQLEQGRVRMPLVLDEALTVADETRFAEIADTLERLAAEEGRQVIYLCARDHEADLWRVATGNRPHHVRLGTHRASDIKLTPAARLRRRVPPVEGKDVLKWAREVGVNRIGYHDEPESVHLFHILRDQPELVYQSLDKWGVDRVGQLKILLGSGWLQAQRAMLERRIELCERWMEGLRKGRGKPLGVEELKSSGLLRSEKYLEEAARMLLESGGDARVLLDALESGRGFARMRYRAEVTENLREWMLSEGYIEQDSVLDEDGRWLYVISAVPAGMEPEEARRVFSWLEDALGENEPGEA